MNIGVIGSGAWGTALAIHFDRASHKVVLYSRDEAEASAIRNQGRNILLPDYSLPESIEVVALNDTVREHELLLIVTPTAGLRPVLENWIVPFANKTPVLAACKGFEQNTGLLPHQVLQEMLPQNDCVGLLSGPSFAQEVAQGLPCAVCLASHNVDWAESLSVKLNNNILRLYFNSDPIGVAVGAAVKNVMAIATGVADGIDYGMNARAALLTRGLAEMTRLSVALGGQEKTMMGLSGMGDLILTCTGSLSRNRQVGLKLAEGKSLSQILQELGHVAEGVNTVGEVVRMAEIYKVDMPITRVLFDLLQGKVNVNVAVERLMLREPTVE